MYILPAIPSKILTKDTNFSNCLLIVYDYSKIPKKIGMENITTKEVMDKQDSFQASFLKVDAFCWWDMEIIQTYVGTHFTSKDFQGFISVREV